MENIKNTENKDTNSVTKEWLLDEFVIRYNDAERPDLLAKKAIYRDYVPYEEKCKRCENIVKISNTKKTETGDVVRFDSAAQYMFYNLTLIDVYTKIKINFKDCIREFNLLNQHGIVDAIIQQIPEREFKEFGLVLNMVETDFEKNEYETGAFIRNQVERFGQLTGAVTPSVIEGLTKALENIDEKKLGEALGKNINKIMKRLK